MSIENLKNFSADLKLIIEKEMERGRGLFLKEIKQFMLNAPIQAIAWTQFTPYFNDGDVCEFRVYDVYTIIHGFDKDDIISVYEYEEMTYDKNSECVVISSYRDYSSFPDDYHEYESKYGFTYDINEQLKEITNFITNNENLMKDIFGDHVEVIVYKNENNIDILTRDIEHD